MGAMEERQELTAERAAMLAAMGVQVWYRRGVSAGGKSVDESLEQLAEEAVATSRAPVPAPQPDPADPPLEQVQPGAAQVSHDNAQPAGTETRPAATEPTVPQQAESATEAIEFTWVKGASGMVICAPRADAATLELVKDVVVFGDWLRARATDASGANFSRPAEGDFRWPQLLDTGGTPARALAVFIDKHLPPQDGWLALTAEVTPALLRWVEELPVTVVELPGLQHNIGDTATKKTIWQSLRTSA